MFTNVRQTGPAVERFCGVHHVVVQRTSLSVDVPQALVLVETGGANGHALVSGTIVLVGVHQTVELSVHGRGVRHHAVPLAAIFVCVPQAVDVPENRRVVRHVVRPRAPVLVRPGQAFHVAVLRGGQRRAVVPRQAHAPGALQAVQMAGTSGHRARARRVSTRPSDQLMAARPQVHSEHCGKQGVAQTFLFSGARKERQFGQAEHSVHDCRDDGSTRPETTMTTGYAH